MKQPKKKPQTKIKLISTENNKVKKMIYDLFRVCDCWVDISCFVRFENEFSQVTKKYGFDLHQIYFGKSFSEMKRTYKRYGELKRKHKYPFSDSVPAKKLKDGKKYVVFKSFPKDQQKAWLKIKQNYNYLIIKGEKGEKCISHKVYEKFYDEWVRQTMVSDIQNTNVYTKIV